MINFSNFTDIDFFEDFLHIFLGGGDEKPFDKEYKSSFLGNGTFQIVEWGGIRCENPIVYEALKPHLQKYGYQLNPDNTLSKKENL